MFKATGDSKTTARYNVAQTALNILGPKIRAELERRKVEKQQKFEARKAEREERLKREEEKREAEKSEGGDGEVGSGSDENVKKETVSDGNASGDTEQKPKDVGMAGDQETKPSKRGRGTVRVLKDIRPGVSCIDRLVPDATTDHHVAQIVVDGHTFEGRGDSQAYAKAVAAASALTTLFNLSFEYSPRKNFSSV